MADKLKRYAHDALLPGYRERFLRAAHDLEAQAVEQRSSTEFSASGLHPKD